SSPEKALQGPYDHILETFAEKYVQPKLYSAAFQSPPPPPPPLANVMPRLPVPDADPVLSLGSVNSTTSSSTVLPLWMNVNSTSTASSSTSSTTPSPSVSLTLSPSEPVVLDSEMNRLLPVQQMGALVLYCKELEEGRQSWLQHKKEATWRLNRLEQQLESEKARKKREKMEEMEAKIRRLREEEMAYLGRIESDYREQVSAMRRDAENKEAKLLEAWCSKHTKLTKLVEQIGNQGQGLVVVAAGNSKDMIH
ncbi:transcription factor AS1-like, partial [Cucurbita pepo subsp. pepo]